MNDSKQQELEEVKKHITQHVVIAIGLAVGAISIVVISQLAGVSPVLKTVVVIGIAAVQAFLIAGFFMHLLSEKKLIYSVLVFTALFFAVMMTLTTCSHMPENVVHIR